MRVGPVGDLVGVVADGVELPDQCGNIVRRTRAELDTGYQEPDKGVYKEVLNTQWKKYHGTWDNETPQTCHSIRIPRHNQPFMIEVNVPALGAVVFEVEK